MTLTTCPDCQRKVLIRLPPAQAAAIARIDRKSGWPAILGSLAGTYFSAQAVVSIVLGTVLFITFAPS